MSDARRLAKLGKFLALILRHQPERFALTVDERGWASLSEVLLILQGLPNFRWAMRTDVMQVVEGESEDVQRRFEVQGDRIRACYGHSFDRRIIHEPCAPPRVLYCGRSRKAIEAIHLSGLLPMERQYVQLSPDPERAAEVGACHGEPPIVVTVRAGEAYASGIEFFRAGGSVYLAKCIPPEFLSIP